MRFGIGIPSSHQGIYLPTPFAGPQEMSRVVELAESLGYYSAWGLDFMTPWDNPIRAASEQPEWHEILVTLAYLAARTTKIRLGTVSLQLPLRNPFIVARQASTLDVLSNGRLMLGVGMGFARIEFLRMYPRDKSPRGERFGEYLEVMHQFLTRNGVSFEGKYYACDQLCMLPKPVQDPFPLYISGVTDAVFDRLIKYGSGWLLSRAQTHDLDQRLDLLDKHLEKAGRKRGEIDLVAPRGLCIGKTREEAMARFRDSVLPFRMDKTAEVYRTGSKKPSEDDARVLEQNFIGTPNDIIQQINEVRDRKITHCILYFMPVKNVHEMCEQIQLFGESILPHFRN